MMVAFFLGGKKRWTESGDTAGRKVLIFDFGHTAHPALYSEATSMGTGAAIH
jgi:hypothetical protein